MGNSKSKKKKNEPKNFFDRIHKEEEARQQAANRPTFIRITNQPNPGVPPPRPPRTDPQPPSIPYDKEAIDRMRNQLKHNPSAFLLNNIMLSMQFLENYEKILSYLKNDSITESDRTLNDNMAQHQKHVFLPDKLQEIIDAHVCFYDRTALTESNEGKTSFEPRSIAKKMESLQHQRMFIIHDNIDANLPGEVSDYSTISNAPHYNFIIEATEEPGYVKLKKLESNRRINQNFNDSPISSETKRSFIESGEESDISDISKDEKENEGLNFMNDLKNKVNQPPRSAYKKNEHDINHNKLILHGETTIDSNERRPSGILKTSSTAVMKGHLNSKNKVKKEKPLENEEKRSVSESESSGYKTSHSTQTESDYGYATITAETTLKRLEMSQLSKTYDSTSEIPSRCISTIEVKKLYSDDDDDNDEAYEARIGEYQIELFKKVQYLNSRIFMLNFSDLFQIRLASPLGFDELSLSNALTQGASIYCEVKNNKLINSYEVVPAISLTWPSDAAEWLFRNRNKIRNPRTNYVYQWPTPDMVSKSKALGCYATPMGFIPTRGTNPQQALQWKLTFPTVERYLETCMAHSQVRCYIFSLILFKKFLEIKDSNIGFSSLHIKNHLFWQMEENYARWPEDRLGEALIIFLKSFYDHLMKSKLPNYFVPKCNLAKGIPKTILLKQQKKLAEILESPVMHLLSSLRSVRYVKQDFYPVLNFKKLYNIIICEDILRLINPQIPSVTAGSEDENTENEFKSNKKGFWDQSKREKNPEYYWRKQYQRQREAIKKETVSSTTTIPKEQIELKKKILPLDFHKKRMILDMFIPHFITIADCSVKFESLRQALLYLEHARRLAQLMKEEQSSEGQGREYIAIINEKIDTLRTIMVKPKVPELPTRNESFTNPVPGPSGIRPRSLDQYVNINSTSSSDHHGNYRYGSESPTAKMAGVVFADVHIETEKPKPIRAVSFQKVDEESEDSEEEKEESHL